MPQGHRLQRRGIARRIFTIDQGGGGDRETNQVCLESDIGNNDMVDTNQCWAACLGNCGGGLSREHVISKGLFVSSFLDVTGFPWCNGGTKRIGIESLTKRALCVKHNNDLSPLDS